MTQYIYVPEIDLHFTKKRILSDKNWQTTKDILKSQGMAMPTPFQFRAHLRFLRDSPEYQELYKDITEVRDPWRAEGLNARFERREDGMYMISEDALIDGKYEDQILKLDDCLMEDKRISLDEYLDSTTPHGLPFANISNGELYYWSPQNGYVAGFSASSFRASLGCSRDPALSNPGLGVHGARKFSEQSSTLNSIQEEKLYSIENIEGTLKSVVSIRIY